MRPSAAAGYIVDRTDREIAVGYTALSVLGAALLAWASGPKMAGPWAPIWPVLFGALAAGLSTITPLTRDAPVAAIARAVSWAWLDGWLTYGVAYPERTFTHGYWGALAFIGAANCVVAWWTAMPTDHGMPMTRTVVPAQAGQSAADEQVETWATWLRQQTKFLAGQVTVSPLPAGGGYRMIGRFLDGHVWQELGQYEAKFASALNLPEGCGVSVEPHPTGVRSGFSLLVTTENRMSESRPYPAPTPLTINGPLPWGFHRDGTPAEAHFRQRCAIVVGATGSGKTVTLQNLNASLFRCPDVVVMHMDLGGAGLSLDWLGYALEAWSAGRTARPVIDWVATDVPEAIRMAKFALEVILARRRIYAGLRRANNTDLLPVSPEVPAIIIVIDEGAETAGEDADDELVGYLTRIVELGRSVAVRVIFSGLRPTSEIIPTRMLRQFGVRIGLQVNDADDIGHLFGWRVSMDPAETPYVGCGRWRDGLAGEIRPYRSHDLSEPLTLEKIARACEDRRPDVDELSVEAVSAESQRDYRTRWDRAIPQLLGDRAVEPPDDRRPAPAATATLTRPARAEVEATRDLAAEGQEWDEIANQLADERARGEWEVMADKDSDEDDPRRVRMRELVEATGTAGISGPRLMHLLSDDDLAIPKTTLFRWLAQDCTHRGYARWTRKETR